MVETIVQLVIGFGVPLFAVGWVWKDANQSDRALKQTGQSDLLVWGICAVFAAFASAMTVTWQLVTRNPALDEESYALVLLVFFFIVLFDLFLLPPLALTKAREANAWTAVLWSLKFFLGGLLAATGFVLCCALFLRFLNEYPQAARVLDVGSDAALLLLVITQAILFLRRWQAGKALREKQASANDLESAARTSARTRSDHE